VLRGRLRREHVQRRARHLPALQRGKQCFLVDDATPGHVHQPHAALARGQALGVEQVARLVRERRVHGDEVRLGQHARQRDGLHARRPRRALGQDGVVPDHVHAHRGAPVGHLAADPPEADHAQGFPRELRAGEALAVPLPALQARHRLWDVS